MKRYWSEVQVGESLPPLVKEAVTRVQIVRYAGASGDFNPMNVDEVHAKENGMPGVVAPGLLIMSFLGQMVTDWASRQGRVRSLGARFVKYVWPGDLVTCRGRVIRLGHEEGRYTVALDLWAENQRGELVVKGSGEIQLFHSAEDEARQARGEGPLLTAVVIPPSLEERIGAPMEPVRSLAARPKKKPKKAPGRNGRAKPKTAAAEDRAVSTKAPTKATAIAKAKVSPKAPAAKATRVSAKPVAAKPKPAQKKAAQKKAASGSAKPAGAKATGAGSKPAAKKAGVEAKPAPKKAAPKKAAAAKSKVAPRKASAAKSKASRG